jgi:hypothetical protein
LRAGTSILKALFARLALLCFCCGIANECIDIIEKRTNLKGDDAIDLTFDLIDLAKRHALECCLDGTDAKPKHFLAILR